MTRDPGDETKHDPYNGGSYLGGAQGDLTVMDIREPIQPQTPVQTVSFMDWMDSDSEMLQQLIRALEEAHLPRDEERDPHLFPYIPLNPVEFLTGLRQAENLIEGRRFLDVGCGIGSKLFLARLLGWQTFGIEIKAEYAAVARRVVPGAMISEFDAGEYVDYEAFDLIYSYRPAHDDTVCIGLEQRMMKGMRSGALLWLPGPRGEIDQTMGPPVGNLMWRKP